jgi:hypothetical protein
VTRARAPASRVPAPPACAPLFATADTVAPLLYTARGRVTAVRSGKAAIHASGAVEVFRVLGGDDRAAALGGARVLHDTLAPKPRMYHRQFYAFCQAMWADRVWTSIRFTQMRAFIASYVVDRGNHAKSSADIVSYVRRAGRAKGEWALTVEEERELAADCRWLRVAFPSPRAPRAPSRCVNGSGSTRAARRAAPTGCSPPR